MKLPGELDAAREPVTRIVRFEPRMLAVEQRGREHLIAVGGVFVAQIPDMIGDPEDFLHEDQPAASFACRLRVIDRDGRAVGHRHRFHRAGHSRVLVGWS